MILTSGTGLDSLLSQWAEDRNRNLEHDGQTLSQYGQRIGTGTLSLDSLLSRWAEEGQGL